ncbi:MAG: hypothetical protein KAJ42_17420 [Gemmatimonadetes bacterium]|nr:hypothetical protein [Gemmatimonadota bacterium]
MILRRNFLHLLVAAPLLKFVEAFHAEPTWKPVGKYKKYIGTMRITPEAMEAVQGRTDAFEAYLTSYHQTLVMKRPRSVGKITGITDREIEISALGR